MNNNQKQARCWTIGKKLFVSFLTVAAITLALGLTGYYGAVKSEEAVVQLGNGDLPTVQSLLTLMEKVEMITGAQRTLLNPAISNADYKLQLDSIAKATEDCAAAWKVYEAIPQSAEEAAVWKEFVPAWEQWKKDNDEFFKISAEREALMATYAKQPQAAEVPYGTALVETTRIASDVQEAFKTQVQEWKNILLRGNDPVKYAKYLAAFEKEEMTVQARMAKLVELMRQLGLDAPKGEDAMRKHAALGAHYREALKKYDKANPNAGKEADLAVTGIDRPIADAFDSITTVTREGFRKFDGVMRRLNRQGMVVCTASGRTTGDLLDKVAELNKEEAANVTKSSIAAAKILKITSLAATIAGVALALGLGLLISRSINRALRRIASSLGQGAGQTTASAGQVAQSSQSMAEGASQQASSLEETSASLEEITSMTRHNADNAQQAMTLMGQAKEVVGGMARATEEMSKAIMEIKASADQTAKIVKTIDEIAFQTNLLALNAAVEAARAGDAGKGFAVVAEEVRNLARRSAEAAKNTAAMIEGSVKNADNGVQVTHRVS